MNDTADQEYEDDEEDALYVKRVERAIFLSSLMTVVAFTTLFLTTIFAMALLRLTAKYKVTPILISPRTLSSDELIIKDIFNIRMSSTSKKAIIETAIRKYVEARYTFFDDTEYMRASWGLNGPFRIFSTWDAFNEDYRFKGPKELQGRIEEFRMKYQSRSVVITKLAPMKKQGVDDLFNWNIEYYIYQATKEESPLYAREIKSEKREHNLSIAAELMEVVANRGSTMGIRNPLNVRVSQFRPSHN